MELDTWISVAMAEMRHSTTIGTRSSSSPMKRDSDPAVAAASQPFGSGGDIHIDGTRSPSRGGRYYGRYRDLYTQTQSVHRKAFCVSVVLFLAVGLVFLPSLWHRLVCSFFISAICLGLLFGFLIGLSIGGERCCLCDEM